LNSCSDMVGRCGFCHCSHTVGRCGAVVGREKFGGLDGGEEGTESEVFGLFLTRIGEPRARCRSVGGVGDDGSGGPSSGDPGLEPGMGSKPGPKRVRVGEELRRTVLRVSMSTFDMS